MIALVCFVLAVLAAPFWSKSLERRENAAVQHQGRFWGVSTFLYRANRSPLAMAAARGRSTRRAALCPMSPASPTYLRLQWSRSNSSLNTLKILSGTNGLKVIEWRDATEARPTHRRCIAGNGPIAIGSIVDEIGYVGTASCGKGYSGDEDRHAFWHPAIVDRGHAARSGGLALNVGT